MISSPMAYPFLNCWFGAGRHIGEIEADLTYICTELKILSWTWLPTEQVSERRYHAHVYFQFWDYNLRESSSQQQRMFHPLSLLPYQ